MLRSRRDETIFVLAIVTAALLLRAYVTFFSGLPNTQTDTYSYFEMADQILLGAPISFFPNGFPLIIAGTKLLFGVENLSAALLAMNVLMSAAVVLFAYLIARGLDSSSLGYIAIALVAIWPNQINYVRQIMSEVPCTFFLVLGILLLFRGNHALSGISLYFAGMIRTVVMPVGILCSIWLLLHGKTKQAAILLCGVVSAYGVDLALQLSGVTAGSSTLGLSMLNAITFTSTDGYAANIDGMTRYQRDHPFLTYLTFAGQHPLEFTVQRFAALWELWGPWPEPGDPAAPRSTLTRILIGARFPLLLLAIYAIWNRRWTFEFWVVAIPIVIITGVTFVFYSTPRYSYPVEPFVLILAVFGARDAVMGFCPGHRALRKKTDARRPAPAASRTVNNP